jgi:hypothetical protein
MPWRLRPLCPPSAAVGAVARRSDVSFRTRSGSVDVEARTFEYPEEKAVRRQIADAVSRARRSKGVRGDQLVEAYDGEHGKRSASDLAKATAQKIADHFGGSQLDLFHAVKHAVPSARPANMKPRAKGMKHDKARTKLRAGDIEDWGIQRLLAVAAAVGLKNPRISFDD